MTKQKLTISITDVMKIHAIACASWKSKIASTYLPRVDKDQNIKFTQNEIDEMFKAASKDQKVTLEEVFGKQSKPIDWGKIKTGSKIMIKYTGQHCSGIDAIDKSEPVSVVFFNTPHRINESGHFFTSGGHGRYCTFNQNGKFVVFSSDDEEYKNYITEVIEY